MKRLLMLVQTLLLLVLFTGGLGCGGDAAQFQAAAADVDLGGTLAATDEIGNRDTLRPHALGHADAPPTPPEFAEPQSAPELKHVSPPDASARRSVEPVTASGGSAAPLEQVEPMGTPEAPLMLVSPHVIGRPELIYLYEVDAQEMTPMDFELADGGPISGEVTDVVERETALRSTSPWDDEPLMFEVVGAQEARGGNQDRKGRSRPTGQAELFGG